MPTVLAQPDGEEHLVYNGFWKGRFDLYLTEVPEPVSEPEHGPDRRAALGRGGPAALRARHPGRRSTTPTRRTTAASSSSSRTPRASSASTTTRPSSGASCSRFSDYLGDRRIARGPHARSTASRTSTITLCRPHRPPAVAGPAVRRPRLLPPAQTSSARSSSDRRRRQGHRRSSARSIYPFSFYHRAELGVGYSYPRVRPLQRPVRSGDRAAAVRRDRRRLPVRLQARSGRRLDGVRAAAGRSAAAAGVSTPSTRPTSRRAAPATRAVDLDLRQYIPVTRRSNFAIRLFAGGVEGNAPTPIYFGGLDTIRGFDFRELVGDRGVLRQPRVPVPADRRPADPDPRLSRASAASSSSTSAAPGSASSRTSTSTTRTRAGSRTAAPPTASASRCASSACRLNWDFAQQTNFEGADDGFATSFWIGTRF